MASKNPHSPANYAPAMAAAMKNTKVYGMPTPMKKPMMKGKKKMAPEMVAKRKKSMISNAASKVMGGMYSK